MKNRYRQQRVYLWMLIILGFVFHTLGELMPLFWAKDIAVANSGDVPDASLAISMALSYFVPTVAIFVLLFGKGKVAALIAFVLAALMLLFNAFHSTGDLIQNFSLRQVFILPTIFIVNLFLAVISWKAYRQMTRK